MLAVTESRRRLTLAAQLVEETARGVVVRYPVADQSESLVQEPHAALDAPPSSERRAESEDPGGRRRPERGAGAGDVSCRER